MHWVKESVCIISIAITVMCTRNGRWKDQGQARRYEMKGEKPRGDTGSSDIADKSSAAVGSREPQGLD